MILLLYTFGSWMFLSTSVHGIELFPLKVVFLLKLSFLDLVFLLFISVSARMLLLLCSNHITTAETLCSSLFLYCSFIFLLWDDAKVRIHQFLFFFHLKLQFFFFFFNFIYTSCFFYQLWFIKKSDQHRYGHKWDSPRLIPNLYINSQLGSRTIS